MVFQWWPYFTVLVGILWVQWVGLGLYLAGVLGQLLGPDVDRRC